MTTIAWDGKTIAADSMAYGSFAIQIKKINQYGKLFIACSGETQQAIAFNKWIEIIDTKEKPSTSDMKNFTGLVIDEHGKCFRYDDMLCHFEVSAPYAIGSGCDFAMGAMLAGKTAEEAVEIAKELDCYTGGDVQVVILHEAEDEKRIENCIKQYKRRRADPRF